MAEERMTLVDRLNNPARGQDGTLSESVTQDMRDAAHEINAHSALLDLVKNVAGFDDSLLQSADLNVLRGTLREYRDQARAVLPSADRRSV